MPQGIHSRVGLTDCALLQDALLEVLPAAAPVAGSGSHGGVFIGESCLACSMHGWGVLCAEG